MLPLDHLFGCGGDDPRTLLAKAFDTQNREFAMECMLVLCALQETPFRDDIISSSALSRFSLSSTSRDDLIRCCQTIFSCKNTVSSSTSIQRALRHRSSSPSESDNSFARVLASVMPFAPSKDIAYRVSSFIYIGRPLGLSPSLH